MRPTHLRATRCDSPFAGVEIHLRPFCSAKLFRSNEHQRCELNCGLHYVVPVVAVKRSKELRNLSRIRDCRSVRYLDGRQCAAQVRGGVTLGPSGSDRITKHLSDALLGAVRRLMLAAALEPSKYLKELRRRQGRNRP